MQAPRSSDFTILAIDTSLDTATVVLSHGERLIDQRTNARQMDHASWIHTAIRDLLDGNQIKKTALSAIAVTEGPGSYTGLRVGMATAKGLSYALEIPLITINTLYCIARAQLPLLDSYPNALICPMIDARRMEVFTALFDATLKAVTGSEAIILDETTFKDHLEKGTVIFAGNGCEKWRSICTHPHAIFSSVTPSTDVIANIAAEKFRNLEFADLAYSEPAYVKNVYIAPSSEKEK